MLTHGHYDHCSDTGKLARKFNSQVVCSRRIAEPLAETFGLDPNRIVGVTAGDTVDFDDIRIDVLRSVHASTVRIMTMMYKGFTGEEPPGDMSLNEIEEIVHGHMLSKESTSPLNEIMKKMHEAGLVGGEQLNFVFQTTDNLRCYVFSANPEEYLRTQIANAKPNILFMQLTAKPEDVAAFADLSGAEVIFPTHHDFRGPEAAHKSAGKLADCLAAGSSARVIDSEYGKWYEIGVKVLNG
jgi:hypothetical protein